MRPKLLYKLLASLFLGIGVLTLLNIAGVWHLSGEVRLLSLGYAGMDFLIAWGFYAREWWVLPALLLNFLGNAITAAILFANPNELNTLRVLISVVLSGGVLLFVYQTRLSLKKGPWDKALGGIFAILWILLFMQRGIF